MPITAIETVYRAVVFVDTTIDRSDPHLTSKRIDAAIDRVHAVEVAAEALARQDGMNFKSLNTQVLWQAALQLESQDEALMRSTLEAIEALVQRTEGVFLEEA